METFVEAPSGARQRVTSFEIMAGEEVPHLHRVSPGGDWLASFDPQRERLLLRNLERPRWSRRATVVTLTFPALKREESNGVGFLQALPGGSPTQPHIREFRWLADGSGFVFQGEQDVWLAPWTPGSKEAVGQPLFAGTRFTVGHVRDVRTFAGGILVRAFVHHEGATHRLFHIRVKGRAEPTLHDMTPDVGWLTSATVLSRGRIVVAVQGLPSDDGTRAELWTFSTDGAGSPRRVDSRPCATEHCHIANWTPGSERPVYALGDGRVVIEVPARGSGPPEQIEVAFSVESLFAPYWSGANPIVHSLWMHESDRQVLGATAGQVIVWDQWGRTQWSWTPSPGDTIYSARFEPGTQRVVVTTDSGVRFLHPEQTPSATGSRVTVTRLKKTTRRTRRGRVTQHFVDAMPLPGGGLALTRVARQLPRKRSAQRSKRMIQHAF